MRGMPNSTLRDRALPNLPSRDLDATEAFALLARLSQDTNTKLVDVAAQIVVAGPETS